MIHNVMQLGRYLAIERSDDGRGVEKSSGGEGGRSTEGR